MQVFKVALIALTAIGAIAAPAHDFEAGGVNKRSGGMGGPLGPRPAQYNRPGFRTNLVTVHESKKEGTPTLHGIGRSTGGRWGSDELNKPKKSHVSQYPTSGTINKPSRPELKAKQKGHRR
ncbi:hypothetical protein MAPG_10657 [Magnaporthiopsis poae ATCC 64411]|uniref:Uncharacterized protein n=1 Tax=Magnaporthiopsis poae (strain ATCC 64411 / 73-15) TaxID=644358 RepID=A0A0C4ED64_MAGP6|nr:hypothetical protein MAPG_10657 [Magnaporthiopsis poae ATCC 64411]